MTLAISPAHAALLAGLQHASTAPRVVVIGAAALGHHVPLTSETKDVDLVVVADATQIHLLLTSLGWAPDRRQAQRWRDADQRIVDVLPANDDVIAAGYVMLGKDYRMSTDGFDLALGHAERVQLPGSKLTVEVASLPALLVLKMAAVLERPHERGKDLQHIGRVLEAALEEDDERRWEPPLVDIEFEQQAAYFVGRQVATEIESHHRALIDSFLGDIAKRGWEAAIGAGGLVCTDPEEVAKRRLAAFHAGATSETKTSGRGGGGVARSGRGGGDRRR